jgi:hypothetical protein
LRISSKVAGPWYRGAPAGVGIPQSRCCPRAEDGRLGVAIWACGEDKRENQPVESQEREVGRK